MDPINPPEQVLLKEQREIYEDREQQSGIISFQYHGRSHSQAWWRHHFAHLLRRDLLWPRNSPSLPFTMQSSQPFPLKEGITLSSLDSSLQGLQPHRDRAPAHQAIRRRKVGNRVTKTSDVREERHKARQGKISEMLAPLINTDHTDHSVVLLCWGKPNKCHIIPVKIPISADAVAVWQEIRRGWFAHRGGWRKRAPLLGVRQVDIVDVRPPFASAI